MSVEVARSWSLASVVSGERKPDRKKKAGMTSPRSPIWSQSGKKPGAGRHVSAAKAMALKAERPFGKMRVYGRLEA